jgi:hypothetical protein
VRQRQTAPLDIGRRVLRFALLTIVLLASPLRGEVINARPTVDDDVLLHNPDMGWVLYENYPVDARANGSSTLVTLPNENFDGVDEVAVMFTWADVEREPAAYDFRDVDHAYDYWAHRGKRIQLRMSAESLLWWNNEQPPRGIGVPRNVLDRMPAEHKKRRQAYGFEYDMVDARDPVYVAALQKFLAAVAAHFDDRRPVTLTDLRGFGLWGEWHTGFPYATIADRREALTKIIDVWSAAMPNHRLALSYSHDPDGPKSFYDGPAFGFDEKFTTTYAEWLAYSAFDHALSKPNITWRRDGVGGAVFANQRQLADETFARLDRGPFMCEFLDGYEASKRGGRKWLEKKLDDALSLHPNYINLLGYQAGDALAFMRGQPELFKRGLREMGYRLVPTEVRYPREVRAGETFKLNMTWQNRGVGRAMRDFQLRVIVGRTPIDAGTLETSKWIKGRTYEVGISVVLPKLEPGQYPLDIAVIDPRMGRPVALPLRDGAIGTIIVP